MSPHGIVASASNLITRLDAFRQDGTSSAKAIDSITDFNNDGSPGMSAVGYYDRWVTLNSAVTAYQQKMYYDGADAWYVTSINRSGDGALVNGSAVAFQEKPALGAFKAIAINRTHTRTVSFSGSGVWSYLSNKSVPDLVGTTIVACSDSQGSITDGDAQDAPIDTAGNGDVTGWKGLDYWDHVAGANYSSTVETALRNVVTELNFKTAWMAIAGDDDGTGVGLGNVDWDTGSGIYANNGNSGTPSTVFFKDVNNSSQKLQAGQSNANEHMMVTLWTHNTAEAVSSDANGGPNIMGDNGTGSYTNGMKTTTMIMPDEFKGEVGSTSTAWASPLFDSTIGKLNNRLVLLYK